MISRFTLCNKFRCITCAILIITAARSGAQSFKKQTKASSFCDIPDTDKINGRTYFSGCNFAHANFYWAQFHKKVHFDHCIFTSDANFDGMTADSGASFIGSRFLKGFTIYRLLLPKTRFDSTLFNGETRFERVSFDSLATFRYCTFNNKISFIDIEFSNADFSHLKLSDTSEINFHNCLANTMDFSFNPHIPNEIRLVDAFNFNPSQTADESSSRKRCLVNLYKSDIAKFYLNYRDFKLYFPAYQDPSGNSDSTDISLNEKIVIYEALLNNFKNHGQTEDYKLLDIEYQTFKLKSEGHWFYCWLSQYWWNFGYNKEYIFKWSAWLVLIFSLINLLFIKSLTEKIYLTFQPENQVAIPDYISWKKRKNYFRNFVTIFKRFWYAFVFTTTLFFFISIKLDKVNYNNVIGTLYIFCIYLSGLICLAYMANFILQR